MSIITLEAKDSKTADRYAWTLNEKGDMLTFDRRPPVPPDSLPLPENQQTIAVSGDGKTLYLIEFKDQGLLPTVTRFHKSADQTGIALDLAAGGVVTEGEGAVSPPLPAFNVSDEQLEYLIKNYCKDLTARVRKGKKDPITGRDKEVEQVMRILLQRGRSNALLLGEPGVGKTAVFTAVAQRMVAGDVPESYRNARVIEVDYSSMSAGAKDARQFEGRFIPLIKGVAERYDSGLYPPFVLCMDELHTIMPTCDANSASGLSDTMKPYLTEGNIQIIGATTLNEYKQFITKDEAMDRRFQRVHLREPTVEETIEILMNLKAGYERHHNMTVSRPQVEKITKLATEFLRRQNNPDKSIIVMDGACAYARMKANKAGKVEGLLELDNESIIEAIAQETGLHVKAIE